MPETKAKDPVCGMTVDPAAARGGSCVYQDTEYFFCNPKCNERFRSEPGKYLSPDYRPGEMMAPSPNWIQPGLIQFGGKPVVSGASVTIAPAPTSTATAYICPMCPEVRSAKPDACPSCGMALEPETPLAASRTEYVCPMHPEISRAGPGTCPVCGMELEPRTVSTSHEPAPELVDMRRRLRLSVLFGVPLLLLAMGEMTRRLAVTSHHAPGQLHTVAWIQLLLASPVVLWAGYPFLQRAITSVKLRSPNMFTLIGLGIGVSYLYSAIATLWPSLFPPSLRGMGGQPEVYFDSAAGIVDSGAGWAGDGASCPRADLQRHPRASRSLPEDGARGGSRWPRA